MAEQHTTKIETDVLQLTEINKMRVNPGMYIGGTSIIEHREYLICENKVHEYKIGVIPSLLKCFDEILVNAIDQCTKHPTKVSNISITVKKINKNKMEIAIKNDGPGIPIIKVKILNGNEVYLVEKCFGEANAGSNVDNSDKLRETGGINGVGSTCVNIHSESFTVTTVSSGLKYVQVFSDMRRKVGVPTITKTKDNEFTMVTFIPSTNTFSDYGSAKQFANYNLWFYNRAIQTAVFTGINISYNKKKLNYDFAKFVDVYCKKSVKFNIKAKVNKKMSNMRNDYKLTDKKYVWNVALLTNPNIKFSIINGIIVKRGTHMNTLMDQIIEYYLKTPVARHFEGLTVKEIKRNFGIIVSGHIPSPEFDSQTKERMTNPKKEYNLFVIPTKHLIIISKIIHINIIKSKSTGKTGKRKNKKISNSSRYEKARKSGKRHGQKCTLYVFEGNSAEVTGRDMIKQYDNCLEYSGIFNLLGVPINVRKNIKNNIFKEKLRQSETFNLLIDILGLDVNCTYKKLADAKRLNYGKVIVITDQDEDGKGHIFGLFLDIFMRLFPGLVARGYICRLNTPIIRATVGKCINEFFYEEQFNKWCKNKNLSTIKIKYFKGLGGHLPSQVKNMGKSMGTDVHALMGNEEKTGNIITYSVSNTCVKKSEEYFGEETKYRKIEIAKGKLKLTDKILNGNKFTVTQYLQKDARDYAIYSNSRVFPGLDGLKTSQRKVLEAAMKYFNNNGNKETKVPNLTGRVMSEMQYHHGDGSLDAVIKRMSRFYPDSNNFPLLLGLGQFGSRLNGDADAAQSRYISVILNRRFVNALFPKKDRYTLDYQFDEGIRIEPKLFAPVLPYILMESFGNPGTGWSCKFWARDWGRILLNVKSLIVTGKLNTKPKSRKLKPSKHGLNVKLFILPLPVHAIEEYESIENINISGPSIGDINCKSPIKKRTVMSKKIVNSYYAMGKWKYYEKQNMINITELPHGTIITRYIYGSNKNNNKPNDSDKTGKRQHITGIAHKPVVEEVINRSDQRNVNIIVILKPGGMDQIKEWNLNNSNGVNDEFPAIANYFRLRKKLTEGLVCMSDGRIQKFKNYDQLLLSWYNIRKNHYVRRLARESIVLKLKIILNERILKFITLYDSENVKTLTDDQLNANILKSGFKPLYAPLIKDPKYISLETKEFKINDELKTMTVLEYEALHGDKISYNHLVNISIRDFTKTKADKLKTTLITLRNQYAKMHNATDLLENTWLSEITEIENIVNAAKKKGSFWENRTDLVA